MEHKLAILTSHPIQYQAPLFRELAKNPEINSTVFFCSKQGISKKKDPGFGIDFKWDIPLLDGYNYKFLKNFSPFPNVDNFWGLINPGIWNEIKKSNFDALLINGYANLSSWIGLITGWLTRTPILFRGETLLSKTNYWFKEKIKYLILSNLLKKVKACLPIGILSKDFYLHFGLTEDRLFMTPYTVDNDYFLQQAQFWKSKKEQIKKEIGITNDSPIILYSAKLIKRKRPMDLLKAFEDISEKAMLIFVGDGALRQILEKHAQEKDIKNVFFLGFKNQSEISKYYAVADIFVLPSSFEPWGLVINEAMCFGLPVITTEETASSRDLVKNRENGFVYRAGDIGSLKKILCNIIDDKEKIEEMGRESLRIINHWNIASTVKGIITALETII